MEFLFKIVFFVFIVPVMYIVSGILWINPFWFRRAAIQAFKNTKLGYFSPL